MSHEIYGVLKVYYKKRKKIEFHYCYNIHNTLRSEISRRTLDLSEFLRKSYYAGDFENLELEEFNESLKELTKKIEFYAGLLYSNHYLELEKLDERGTIDFIFKKTITRKNNYSYKSFKVSLREDLEFF